MHDAKKSPPSRPTFLCDAMLGSLARWLRFFGFDAEYPAPGVPDRRLAQVAEAEGRWLVTRDRELAAVGPRTVRVRAEGLDDQLVEVFSRLGLRPDPDLRSSRCAECNGGLEPTDRRDVGSSVPPHVLATATRFRVCSRCGRVYWPGSHSDRITEKMRSIVGRLGA